MTSKQSIPFIFLATRCDSGLALLPRAAHEGRKDSYSHLLLPIQRGIGAPAAINELLGPTALRYDLTELQGGTHCCDMASLAASRHTHCLA